MENSSSLLKEDIGGAVHSEVIVIGDENASLQDSFAKFLKEKKQQRKLQKLCTQERPPRSEQFKNQLRQKFLEKAKSYMGVPYARKYEPEDTPESPLYLDCCGLVRQVMKDLQEEFGFAMGKWNQAYQFDTLPIRVDSIEKLVPGDLIFYSGEYSSKRSKSQKHDMVHVEIFYGGDTGEATLGARFQKGVVQIFPSYKFPSKLWTLKEYFFCSIDTWLDGRCASVCSEHQWLTSDAALMAAAGSRSIFYDSDDESAGHCSDIDDDEMGGGGDEDADAEVGPVAVVVGVDVDGNDSSAVAAGMAAAIEEIAAVETAAVANSGNHKAPIKRKPAAAGNAVSTTPSGAVSTPLVRSSSIPVAKEKRSASRDTAATEGATAEPVSRSPPPKTYYVSEGNGWRFIKAALDRRGWQQLPFDYSFSTRFSMKWVERRGEIDFKSHNDGQLVNHIPNNDVITTKLGMLNTLRNFYCRESTICDDLESSAELLSSVFQQEQPQDVSQAVKAKSDMFMPTPWLPETYQLDVITDCLALLAADLEAQAAPPAEGAMSGDVNCLWIYKPSCSNRGRGVRVLQGGIELMELLREYHPRLAVGDVFGGMDLSDEEHSPTPVGKKATDPTDIPSRTKKKAATYTPPLPKGIVQRYILHPLLVNGFKFDLRVYMLIARVSPTYKVYYHHGYARRTMRPYTIDMASISDPVVHLSNTSIQKYSSEYKGQKEDQVMSRQQLADAIESGGDLVSAAFIRTGLDGQIKKCIVDIMRASKDMFIRKRGYFDLLGLDFMITPAPENKVVLLEANTNPALVVGMKPLITSIVDGTMELVLAAHQKTTPAADGAAGSETALPEGFELVYDEAAAYEFTLP